MAIGQGVAIDRGSNALRKRSPRARLTSQSNRWLSREPSLGSAARRIPANGRYRRNLVARAGPGEGQESTQPGHWTRPLVIIYN
jgi:hypothetical protein